MRSSALRIQACRRLRVRDAGHLLAESPTRAEKEEEDFCGEEPRDAQIDTQRETQGDTQGDTERETQSAPQV